MRVGYCDAHAMSAIRCASRFLVLSGLCRRPRRGRSAGSSCRGPQRLRDQPGIVKVFDPGVLADGNLLQSGSNGFAVSTRPDAMASSDDRARGAAWLPCAVETQSLGSPSASSPSRPQHHPRDQPVSISVMELRRFDFAHQYVWQALIMLDVLIVWLLWVRTLPRAAPAPRCV